MIALRSEHVVVDTGNHTHVGHRYKIIQQNSDGLAARHAVIVENETAWREHTKIPWRRIRRRAHEDRIHPIRNGEFVIGEMKYADRARGRESGIIVLDYKRRVINLPATGKI